MKYGILTLLLCVCLGTATSADELRCLSDNDQAAGALYRHLQNLAYSALDRRASDVEELTTKEQILSHQAKLRKFFIRQLGGFPNRVPLEPQTVGAIQADGYRIEKVIFQSQTGHHITANLYLPKSETPTPGVVVSSGHSRTAKTADYNQRFGIAMARNGMAALCFDPIGQGERSQILNEAGQPQFKGTTTEHFLVGVGSVLVGRNTARYRVWDAMRAIDYLASRPEVDLQRIGFTGCSGGGTLTSYVMALDDRVACAAPACYLTTFRHLIETIGPQDAEQNVYGQIRFGMDHPDYVLMRAPRPTLISATTGDYFSIQGAWQNYRQSKRVFGRLGFPERVDLVEVDGKHGVQPQNLATITHWMRRWLVGRDEPVAIEKFTTRPPDELLCTKTGQVLTSLPGERSVFDLNTEYAKELAAQRKARSNGWSDEQRRERIRQLIGARSLAKLKPPTWEEMGRVRREEYHIDKLVIHHESPIPLPALTFHPPVPVDAAYLYLHDDGKLGDSGPGGPIEQLMDDGFAVVTVDLCGQGETARGESDPLLTDWKTYYLGYLLGRPLVGMRVEDALAAADFVAYYQKKRTAPREVHLVGVGRAGIVALHAAALKPELFTTVTLRNTPRDWTSVVGQKIPVGTLDSTVHGALKMYDLPDLVRLIGADKVRFEDSPAREDAE